MNSKYNLLFLCAYCPDDLHIKNQLQDAIAEIDNWQDFFDTAHAHSMIPLLYIKLKEQELLTHIPESAVNRMRRFFVLNVARNERLAKLLFNVLHILQGENIDVIPIKGLVLAQELYGDIYWRTMEDLDFVVHPQDMIKARELLLRSGFEDNINLFPDDISDYIRAGYDFVLKNKETGLIIEIGCGISLRYMGFHVLQESMLKERHTIELSGKMVQVLIPEIEFILLCIHGAKHHWCRIIWLNDIVALLNKYPDIDFDKIERFVKLIGAWRIVQTTMHILKIIYNTEIPETVGYDIDKNIKNQAEKIADGILQLDTLNSWQYRWQYMLMLDSIGMRIKYISLLLFTPNKNDWQTIRTPKILRFIYYIIRPFRLLFKSGLFILFIILF